MQIQKSSIRVGSRYVGEVWVDGGAVRGEGGPNRPELVIPLTVSMSNTPVESMVALPWLEARLRIAESPTSDISNRVAEMLVNNLAIRSMPSGNREHQVILRFALSQAEIERLERARHATDGDRLTLHLSVEAVAVAVAATYNQHGQPATDWDVNLGMFSDLQPFWNTTVDLVRFVVEQSSWVRDVLPGFGYERRRLIEVEFPPPLPDSKAAAREWDKARQALDTRRYEDCVSECRDLVNMWTKQLLAGKDNHLADIIATRRGWSADDERIAFIDRLWKATVDFTNLPHHPERSDGAQNLDAEDARLVLLLTATLSEYVSRRAG